MSDMSHAAIIVSSAVSGTRSDSGAHPEVVTTTVSSGPAGMAVPVCHSECGDAAERMCCRCCRLM